MPNRRVVVLLLLAGISLVAGCKKSSESDAPNLFGSPPVVSELSVTKQSRQFACVSPPVDLCCVDPPVCTCCCISDVTNTVTAEYDLVQMSAKVTDADGASNLLVILTRFFDPPNSGTTNEISLEMFDVGTNPVGTILSGTTFYQVLSGDAVANDEVYTRYFYMKSTTLVQPDDCVLNTDVDDFGGTYSQYLTSGSFPATKVLNFTYHVEGVDRAGNIGSSGTVTLPILESEATVDAEPTPCGPPTGAGGCLPPP
ncbi:MAG: hypothetical protein L0Z52_08540 [Acidobacteria bacterium]|nr:hypothetical protein [Acidobacteriota bacterium]